MVSTHEKNINQFNIKFRLHTLKKRREYCYFGIVNNVCGKVISNSKTVKKGFWEKIILVVSEIEST